MKNCPEPLWRSGQNCYSLFAQCFRPLRLEFFGGLLIVGGLYTRPVAFLLSGEMATAFFLSHFPRGYWPIQNGGERAVLFCFIYFFLATAGPGRLSLDGLIAVRSSKR